MRKQEEAGEKPETDSGTKAYLEGGKCYEAEFAPCLCQVSRRNADGRKQYLRISEADTKSLGKQNVIRV